MHQNAEFIFKQTGGFARSGIARIYIPTLAKPTQKRDCV